MLDKSPGQCYNTIRKKKKAVLKGSPLKPYPNGSVKQTEPAPCP